MSNFIFRCLFVRHLRLLFSAVKIWSFIVYMYARLRNVCSKVCSFDWTDENESVLAKSGTLTL